MLPLPSRTHPQKQTPVVYTEELTHLGSNFFSIYRGHFAAKTTRLASPTMTCANESTTAVQIRVR
jgi:hypothetical protein